MDSAVANFFGVVAATASTISFAPQAWKVIRTREARDLSAGTYVLNVAGFACWTTYGVMLCQWPLIACNSICLGLSAFILGMKICLRENVRSGRSEA